jgi:mannose/fructose/N-acetylgalactosamine-specific phosphotransferase system component IIC
MNQNVKRIIIIVAVLCYFFVIFFAVKYFNVSKETSLIIGISIFSILIFLETFVKENYNNTDEKQKVSKYSSLSRYY